MDGGDGAPIFAHMEKISRPFFLSLLLRAAAAAGTAALSGGGDLVKVKVGTKPASLLFKKNKIYAFIYSKFLLLNFFTWLFLLIDLLSHINFIAP